MNNTLFYKDCREKVLRVKNYFRVMWDEPKEMIHGNERPVEPST